MSPLGCARAMLGVEILPISLIRRLDEVSNLLGPVGGALESHQIVALIVADWRRSPEAPGILMQRYPTGDGETEVVP